MSGSDEIMRPGFLGFPSFAQGFGFTIRKAISEAREFSKIQQVGFRQACDTGVGDNLQADSPIMRKILELSFLCKVQKLLTRNSEIFYDA